MLRVPGFTVSEKSADSGAVATVRLNVAECCSVPDVPVTVTVAEPASALADADSVMDCGVPGCRESVDGAAVTPAGSPAMVIDTAPLKPLSAAAERVTC